MASNVHGGRRRRPRAGAHRPRTIRVLGALVLVVGAAGLLTAPAAQASRAHPAPSRALPGPPLWRPGSLRGVGGWLPPVSNPAVRTPGRTWTVQPTPNPARQPNGTLLAASCTGATACTAVGDYIIGAGTTVTLAERWNGTSWRIQATPGAAGATFSRLTGVSCTSAASCTAAGYYLTSRGGVRPLAERWNGATWRIQPTPTPTPAGAGDSGFFGVSCTSALACTATGEYNAAAGPSLTLAERWNGKHWRVQATPNPAGAQNSGLFGVSCAAATACTAAGAYADKAGKTLPLAEAWNGTAWHVQATPSPPRATDTGFNGVSCSAPGACTAIGNFFTSSGPSQIFAERWNGTAWRLQATPSPAGATASLFSAVSCSASRSCTAAGAYATSTGATVTLAEAWNGTSWHIQPTPGPAGHGNGTFGAVSCVSARSCAAVGSSTHHLSPVEMTLAGAWNGTRWSVVATPSPLGAAPFSTLVGVSCPSARFCTAAGSSTSKNATITVTLAESWNGTRWRVQATPNPAGTSSAQFSGVSCPSARFCTAVGSGLIKHRETLLAERWNGTRWRVQATPAPSGVTGSIQFNGVSCASPRFCTAVGYGLVKHRQVLLAERWNGTRWRVQATPVPSGATNVRFNGVSCPSPRACTAAGSYQTSTGHTQALAEAWRGTSWHIQPVPGPAGAVIWALSGVSCSAPGACTAVGSYFTTLGPLTLAERWNGKTWRPQATPNNPRAEDNQLNGVSCASAGACTAVGYYEVNDFTPLMAFAEAWHGSRWRIQAAPGPVGTVISALAGVSCVPARCTGTGYYFGQSNIQVTLAEARAG